MATDDPEAVTAMADQLPIAVRAYSEPVDYEPSRGGHSGPQNWPDGVLTFDTETTTDASQRLLYGVYRYARWTGAGTVETAVEGIIYADDLPDADPDAFGVLEEYAREHRVELGTAPRRDLGFLSRRDFLKEVFHPAVVRRQQLCAGFNLPFDLSRLAVAWGEGRERWYGGFSLILFDYHDEDAGEWCEDRYKPRVRFKTIDSKRAFMQLGQPVAAKGYRPGRLLDLRSLAFALTNRSHSLDSACEAFGVEEGKGEIGEHGTVTPDHIDYCRQDVRATEALLVKLRKEFDRHPVDLDPCRAYSPASISKAYLRAMGLTPPRAKFDLPRDILGCCMEAYYGGRAECRIRGVEVPVVYSDFLSMYPTVNSRMGVWDILTARELAVVDATDKVRSLLEDVDASRCFNPEFWAGLNFFARVRPDGDVLPVRAEYEDGGRNLNIGVNPISPGPPLWYAGPDLVASVLLSGKVPEIIEAFRLEPEGVEEGLEPVQLRGELDIDPAREDFFRRVIELRKNPPPGISGEEQDRLGTFLKVMANSGAYGIYAEMNPDDLPEGETREVEVFSGRGSFTCESAKPESPGLFCFPPLAALTTAGARLMLALLEHVVEDAGGTFAFCDTDSMAIVASPEGGLVPCPRGTETLSDGSEAVRALSWEEVDEIVARFESLNPYDAELVPGSVLEVEEENFDDDGDQRELRALVLSAKRYALVTTDGGSLEVVKASEHGLGHLLNPVDPDDPSTGWIEEFWRWALREHRGEDVDLSAWVDRPAISRVTVSSPHLLRPFTDYNKGKPHVDRVRPMNFLLSPHVRPMGQPAGVDPTRFHLFAPFEPDPDRWGHLRWTDRYTEDMWGITTRATPNAHLAGVRSYRHMYREYLSHPEPKSLGPDGQVCGPRTRGLLRRRHVVPVVVQFIGKESNCLEEVLAGLHHDRDDVLETYREDEGDPLETLRAHMRGVPASRLAELAGTSERHIKRIRNGHSDGSGELRERIWIALSSPGLSTDQG